MVAGRSKYGNKKTVIDGIKFDSKAESQRYIELKLLLRAGLIKDLKLQPEFELQPAFKHRGKTVRAIHYTADFQYLELYEAGGQHGDIIIEDVKGMQTEVFKLKAKLLLHKFNHVIELRIIQ